VGHNGGLGESSFLFDQPDNYRDVELLVPCDNGVLMLCEMLGWRYELEELIRKQMPDWCLDKAGINLRGFRGDKKLRRNQRSINNRQ
jgi:hypothetical protein